MGIISTSPYFHTETVWPDVHHVYLPFHTETVWPDVHVIIVTATFQKVYIYL